MSPRFCILCFTSLHTIEIWIRRSLFSDDPMSSFDSERRRKTVHLITDIVCKYKEADGTERSIFPKQKIILTHEDRFEGAITFDAKRLHLEN